MSQTITVLFDGEVLRPDSPLDLKPNARYRIIIQDEPEGEPGGNAWDVLEALAGSIEAPPDWASEHDHYLYGIPKQGSDRHFIQAGFRALLL
jgi:hypothetical protein